MASNALCLFPSSYSARFPSIFRYESGMSSKTPLLLINQISSSSSRRLAVSTDHSTTGPTFTTPTSTGTNTSSLSELAEATPKTTTTWTTGTEKVEHSQEQPRLSFTHFFDKAKDFARADDGGAPRWFSPEDCGLPVNDSPLLLFLPGIDGTGLGLVMHHQKLGKIFEVFCLHIPPKDRTPFTELVKMVERKIRSEYHHSPDRPIYLVGESIGACLALSVAALNPDIDLVLILANPATSFSRSPLQPMIHLLQFLPDSPNLSLPHILSTMTGLVMASLEKGLGHPLPQAVVAPSLSYLSVLADILPRETLLWKLKMMYSASSYTNSRLHAVKSQTLILSSGRDQLLPSQEEAQRLLGLLDCDIRKFEDCGHFLFLEDAFDLVTVIKNTGVYRRSKVRDFVSDYIPPSPSELKDVFDRNRWASMLLSPVFLSTLANGKIVRSLAGLPTEGPVLYVGYHMLLGFELTPMIIHFLDQKNIHLRGIAHPMMFMSRGKGKLPELAMFDDFRIMGAAPVSGKSFFKLLSTKSHVLLYPGGVREALHRKGEAYRLFWPERSEFVRMAARFGAKIVPFGVVGEDDVGELILDFEDQMRIPFMRKYIEDTTKAAAKVRPTMDEEEGNQAMHLPGILPKLPGRFYYYFGKTIETKGRKLELRDREKAHELYLEVKSEVEKCLAYLKEKREGDPYRSLVSRIQYQARHGFSSEIPSFELDE